MEGKLLIVLLVVSTASSAVTLKCHVCAEGGVCSDGEIGELQTCPNISSRVANRCLKFDGEYSSSNPGSTFSLKGVIRNCYFHRQEGVPAPPLRCLSGSDAEAYLPNVHLITGDYCFCASDGCNGVDSLKPFLWLILTVGLMHMLLM
ncbi:uncharacterized protein LOC119735218 [Patiria miniata]|uniref:Protein quiver n=1 Tax=Patiria miniata TaxID=46514 RepID=A0A914AMN2_PATMI|nr:uncharacterized protein LOC119735218 [Patiria miniata]